MRTLKPEKSAFQLDNPAHQPQEPPPQAQNGLVQDPVAVGMGVPTVIAIATTELQLQRKRMTSARKGIVIVKATEVEMHMGIRLPQCF